MSTQQMTTPQRRIAEIEGMLSDEFHERAAQGIDPELSASQRTALLDEALHLVAAYEAEGLTLTPDQKRQASEQLALVQAQVDRASTADLLRRVNEARDRGDVVELSLIGMFTSDPYVRSLATQAPGVTELQQACSRIRSLWSELSQHEDQARLDVRRQRESQAIEARARDDFLREMRAAF